MTNPNMFHDADSPDAVLYQLAGVASMCWADIHTMDVGVFQDQEAAAAVEAAKERLAELGGNAADRALSLPVPYTLALRGNGDWIAKWEPAVPSEGLPEKVTESSRSSAVRAVSRLRNTLIGAGVIHV
jgi:hypothetical protein